MKTCKVGAACCAAIAASVWIMFAHAAFASPFYDGEVILVTPNFPDPDSPGNTIRALVRLDPETKETTLLYRITFANTIKNDIAYDPYRDAVIAPPLNSAETHVIYDDGTMHVICDTPPYVERLAAGRSDGKIYYMQNPNTIRILDENGTVIVLLNQDGEPFNEPGLGTNSDSMYYHPESNSIYYDREASAGVPDVDYLVRLKLNEAGTQVESRHEALVNVSSNYREEVSSIGPGPDPDEIFYALDVNHNGLWGRAGVAALDTGNNVLTTRVFAEMGFFGAAAINYGVYSRISGKALMFQFGYTVSTNGLQEYEEGDVEVLVSPLSQELDFAVDHMMVIERSDDPSVGAGASGDEGCGDAEDDDDFDGVNDQDDLCPLTNAGATVDANGCSDAEVDTDGDGICDSGAASGGPSGCIGSDNCPLIANNGQEDTDWDAAGDACDSDDDNDGVSDVSDNCPLTLGGNSDQTDTDDDGAGDICDADLDGDGVDNTVDVCPNDPDPDQTNTDGLADGGDACDIDDDEDGVLDVDDNCDTDVNPLQEDLDGDNIGDACDSDLDGDGVDNSVDNCPVTPGGNGDQTDTDMDGEGDVCDTDDDSDTVLDGFDNCPLVANPGQGDADGDGTGDACNDVDDADGDEWSDALDNCPNVANGNQADFDGDLFGDACDSDIDGDGVDNVADDCAATPLGELSDASGCTIAQLCPCEGPSGTIKPWKNHGKYVSCVAHAASELRDAGLITGDERGDIVSAAGQSDCGRHN